MAVEYNCWRPYLPDLYEEDRPAAQRYEPEIDKTPKPSLADAIQHVRDLVEQQPDQDDHTASGVVFPEAGGLSGHLDSSHWYVRGAELRGFNLIGRFHGDTRHLEEWLPIFAYDVILNRRGIARRYWYYRPVDTLVRRWGGAHCQLVTVRFHGSKLEHPVIAKARDIRAAKKLITTELNGDCVAHPIPLA